jgi:hypothetical protein
MLVRSNSAHPSGCWNGPWKDAPLAVGGPASPSIAGRASGPVLTTLTPSCGPGHAHSTEANMGDDRLEIAKQRQADRLMRAFVAFMLAFAIVALYHVVQIVAGRA